MELEEVGLSPDSTQNCFIFLPLDETVIKSFVLRQK